MRSNTGAEVACALLVDDAALSARILSARARRSGSRSFAAFVKQAWQYVPQVEPLVWGWHMDAIALHAEAVARGEVSWLGIAMPPGHGKSVFTSVLWPAWIWTWWPRCQFIFGSYSHGFVVRDARRCRAVIQSDWYRETYCRPGGWLLREDYGSADNFSNTLGGVRFATSTGGAGAGLRAHVIGIDDPINITDAYSKSARDEVVLWLGQTLSQRFVAGYPSRFLLAMQRLHEDDPMAWLARRPGAQVLRLPTEFEPHDRCTTSKIVERRNGHVERVAVEMWRDPRRAPGDLLFPELYPRDRIEADRETLGSFGFAAQHQQRPSPEGGGLFKVENWRYWKSDDETMERYGNVGGVRPRNAYDGPAKSVDLRNVEKVISVDATFRETRSGSFVAIHVWGRIGSRRLLLHRVKRRMDFTDTVKVLLGVIRLFPDARRKLIEGKANGDAIISALEKTHGVTGCEAVNPGSANKVARAHAQQPLQAAGNVELPDGAPWLEEYVLEHAAFPNGTHDDDVDAQSQALQGLESTWASREVVDMGVGGQRRM